MQLVSNARPKGDLSIRKIGAVEKVDWRWTLRNRTRLSFIFGWIMAALAALLSKVSGIPTLVGTLEMRKRVWDHPAEAEYFLMLRREGRIDEAETYARTRTRWIDYGVVCKRLVTNNGVGAIVDAFQNTFELENFNYHGIGTGTNAENATDTALQTESTTALNPDNTRATGVQSEPASNQYRSVGVLVADVLIAMTEHGLFSQAATGGGVLFDRSVVTVANISPGESMQTTYTLTVNSGG